MPAFDYNIARCYERLNETDSAIEYYERYASTTPAGVEVVRAHLAELKHVRDLLVVRGPLFRAHRRRILAITFGVLGAAAAVGAAVALGITLSASRGYAASTLGPMRVTP